MSETPTEDVTSLLLDWGNGDEQARDRLLPLVYDELRRVAGGFLRHERADHTLQATALVHEAYLRLIDQSRVQWSNSVHFTALAAQMMRRILTDHARSKQYAKRGGGVRPLSLDDAPQITDGAPADVVQVDEALVELARVDPDLARLVELRFFGGLTNDEVAVALGVSVPTVVRRWRLAKAWLYRHLGGESPRGS